MTGGMVGGYIGPGLGMRDADPMVPLDASVEEWPGLNLWHARQGPLLVGLRSLIDRGLARRRGDTVEVPGPRDVYLPGPDGEPAPYGTTVPEGAVLRAAVWRAHLGPAVWRVTPYIALEDRSDVSVVLRPVVYGSRTVGPDRMFLEHADAVAYAHEITHPQTHTRRTP